MFGHVFGGVGLGGWYWYVLHQRTGVLVLGHALRVVLVLVVGVGVLFPMVYFCLGLRSVFWCSLLAGLGLTPLALSAFSPTLCVWHCRCRGARC